MAVGSCLQTWKQIIRIFVLDHLGSGVMSTASRSTSTFDPRIHRSAPLSTAVSLQHGWLPCLLTGPSIIAAMSHLSGYACFWSQHGILPMGAPGPLMVRRGQLLFPCELLSPACQRLSVSRAAWGPDCPSRTIPCNRKLLHSCKTGCCKLLCDYGYGAPGAMPFKEGKVVQLLKMVYEEVMRQSDVTGVRVPSRCWL